MIRLNHVLFDKITPNRFFFFIIIFISQVPIYYKIYIYHVYGRVYTIVFFFLNIGSRVGLDFFFRSFVTVFLTVFLTVNPATQPPPRDLFV